MTAHSSATHQGLNQARPATGWNAFSGDTVLQGVVARLVPWAAGKAGASTFEAPTEDQVVRTG